MPLDVLRTLCMLRLRQKAPACACIAADAPQAPVHHLVYMLQAGNVAQYTAIMERSGGRLGAPDR